MCYVITKRSGYARFLRFYCFGYRNCNGCSYRPTNSKGVITIF